MDRYDQMRTLQQRTQPVKSTMIPVNEAPLLPTITQRKTPAQTPASAPAQLTPLSSSVTMPDVR